MKHSFKSVVVALAVLAGGVVSGVQAAPLYVASFNTMFVIDSNTGLITDSFAIANEGPMAVTNTIRMRAQSGNVRSEYALDGTFIGNTGGPAFGFFGWDGTTDGVQYNYAIPNSSPTTTMYRYDLNWQNETALFTFSNAPEAFGLGIAYDTSDDTLWVANDVPGNDLKHFDLAGNLLGTFAFANGLGRPGALAYNAETDTLWFLTESGNTLLELSKTGTQLNSFVVPGLSHNYNMEFGAVAAAVPAPATLLLLGLGFLGLGWSRRVSR